MRRTFLLVLIILFLKPELSFARPPASGKAEVRAVWVTTASGLDWPRTTDPEEQRSSLLGIVRTLRKQNFNTIFFQVRARGDAYYRSSYEPWAENLTGIPGKMPSFDPLAEVIREAHLLGMEVHAWFNLYKVGNPGPSSENHSTHVARSHADWVFRYDDELWLNPGIPGVNTYLHHVALELVRNYDVDGIQFDFIRYPGMKVPDKEMHQSYGRGKELASWRRENINRFVAAFHDSVAQLRPKLKIGATPVGNFNGTDGNPAGYHEYYQDAVSWVRSGDIDYLAPQIYWDIGSSAGDPDFAALARRWKSVAHGRHMYAGLAPYKPEVLRELAAQIDSARSAGCDGQAFFRLASLGDYSMIGDRYAEPATVPGMPWKLVPTPAGPNQLAVTELAPGVYHLEWNAPVATESGGTFRIYRSASPLYEPVVVAETGSQTTFLIDTVVAPTGPEITYAITAVDRDKNESLASPAVSVRTKGWDELKMVVALPVSFSATVDPSDKSRILLAYSIPSTLPVTITLQQDSRTTTNPLLENLLGERKPPGTYFMGIDRSNFPAGAYYVILKAGDITVNRRLTLE